MRIQRVSPSIVSNNAHPISNNNRPNDSDRHPRGLWSFLTWYFFVSQVFAADRLIAEANSAALEEDAAAARRQKADSAGSSANIDGKSAPGVAASAEAIGFEDAAVAKALAASQAALRADPAPSNELPGLSKSSGGDSAQASAAGSGGGGGGGGSGGGSQSARPGSDNDDSLEPGASSPKGGSSPSQQPGQASEAPGGSTSGGNAVPWPPLGPPPAAEAPGGGTAAGPGVSAEIDVSLPGPTEVSVSVGILGSTVSADVSVSDLLGFDLSVGPDGIFVGAELQFDLPPTAAQLASTPVQLAESLTGIELDHILNADLTAAETLLGSADVVSTINATLAEVTGLSFANGAAGVTDGALSAPVAATIDTLPSAVPVQIAVVADLIDPGSGSQSGALASGGLITVSAPAASDTTPIDALFAGGQYTDYNVALQSLGGSVASAAATEGKLLNQVVTTTAAADAAPDQVVSGNLPVSPAVVELALEEVKLIGTSGISI